MNTTARKIWLRRTGLALAPVLALGTLMLRAQTAPPSAQPTAPVANPAIASMQQDISLLQRQVGELQLDLKALQQDNDSLRKQLITQADVNAAVQNAASKNLDDTNKAITQAVTQATAALHQQIITEFTKKIEDLADQTNSQLQILAKAIGQAPPAPTRVIATNPGNTGAAAPPKDPGPGVPYTVKPGDSISKIATNFRVPISDIEEANPLADVNRIHPGQQLFIPLKNAAPAPPATTK